MSKVKDGIKSVFEAISIAPPDMLTAEEISDLDLKEKTDKAIHPIPSQD